MILYDFVPTSLGEPSNFALAGCAHLEVLAHQWREYYDVPNPFPHMVVLLNDKRFAVIFYLNRPNPIHTLNTRCQ